ncbi:MAG: hypothetical protein FWE37_01760 [Spirochaetaceae bacterium]|nr:hypothetical protein [Spirochaetaceae bacterium]
MKLIEIKDIQYEETAVYYRQKYEGIAVFDFEQAGGINEVPIFFVVEINPLGEKKVLIEFKKNVHYPLIPLLRQLRARIVTMKEDGSLF